MNKSPVTIADIQAQMDTVNWVDGDDKPLRVTVEQLEDGIGAEFLYADSGEFCDYELLGVDLDDAYLAACERTAPTPDEVTAEKILELERENAALKLLAENFMKLEGLPEFFIGGYLIYLTLDNAIDMIKREVPAHD